MLQIWQPLLFLDTLAVTILVIYFIFNSRAPCSNSSCISKCVISYKLSTKVFISLTLVTLVGLTQEIPVIDPALSCTTPQQPTLFNKCFL